MSNGTALHPNPIPAELLSQPGVGSFWRIVERDIARLQAIPGDVVAVLSTLRPSGKSDKADAARTVACDRVSVLQREARTLFERVEAAIGAAQRLAVLGDISAQALVELQETRSWSRMKSMLDSLARAGEIYSTAQDLAREAQARDDTVTLRALWAELPAYLRSRGGGAILANSAKRWLMGLAGDFLPRQPRLPPVCVAAASVGEVLASNQQVYELLFASAMERAGGDGGEGVSRIAVGWNGEVFKW